MAQDAGGADRLLAEILDRMVSSVEWHGALSMDVILTNSGPMIIDINPRLVEPANAFFSGVDLVGAMLDLAAGGKAQVQPGIAMLCLIAAPPPMPSFTRGFA